MTTASLSREEEVRAQFLQYTRNHELTILQDQGVYRHVRFRNPTSSSYWYDLITWPGNLVVNGDYGAYHFARTYDMFEFFGDYAWGINPHYWGEKLCGAHPGRDGAKSYSHEVLRQQLRSWCKYHAAHNYDCEMYPDLVWGALERQFLIETFDRTGAQAILESIMEDLDDWSLFEDSWEWDLRDYDWSFLWCCWAVVEGIKKYKEVKDAQG